MTPHVGWLRTLPRGPWKEVCRGKSEDECWWLLLRINSGAGIAEKLVLPEGEHPERRKKPR